MIEWKEKMSWDDSFIDQVILGDCLEVMRKMPENSIDAIVTDPPYGLEFMGKEWDKDFLHEKWIKEAYRILKPGASMLVMGGTRTFHRLMVAIEDAGFIIKDCLMWLYGSGFPKAQDLSKVIDKRARRQYVQVAIELGLFLPENSKWDWTKGEHGISDKWWEKFKSFLSSEDWQKIEREIIGSGKSGKTAIWNEKGEMGDFDITIPTTDLAKHWGGFKIGGIKPAYEPIVWAVKPPEGSYVDNVLKWGVGAVNVDECRIDFEKEKESRNRWDENVVKSKKAYKGNQDINYVGEENRCNENIQNLKSEGRFPANVILDEEAGKMLDEQSGERKSHDGKTVGSLAGFTSCYGTQGRKQYDNLKGDSGGASRFFYCAKASRGERNLGLEDGSQPITKHNARPCDWEKADWSKRNPNNHPTVKPITLFEWLIKLVTREGQIVLDPFLGSGTAAISADKCGRSCIGIEQERGYVEIADKRSEYWKSLPKQMEIALDHKI